MKAWFAGLAVAGMLLATASQGDAQVGVRVGVSSMTGLAGIEYNTGNVSLGAGPLLDGQVAVSARYALSAGGNSFVWAGLAFVLNRIEAADSVDQVALEAAETIEGIEAAVRRKKFPAVGPLLGYKMALNEQLDLSIGGGYGFYLGVDPDLKLGDVVLNDETGGALLDLSLGYRF